MVDGQTGKIIFRSRISSNKSTSLCTVIGTVRWEGADRRMLVVIVVVVIVAIVVVIVVIVFIVVVIVITVVIVT